MSMGEANDFALLKDLILEKIQWDLLFEASKNQETLCRLWKNVASEPAGLQVMTVKVPCLQRKYEAFLADEETTMMAVFSEQLQVLLGDWHVPGRIFRQDGGLYLLLFLPKSAEETVASLQRNVVVVGEKLYGNTMLVGVSDHCETVEALRAARREADYNWLCQTADMGPQQEISGDNRHQNGWNPMKLEEKISRLFQAVEKNQPILELGADIGSTILECNAPNLIGPQVLGELIKLMSLLEHKIGNVELNEQLVDQVQTLYLCRTTREIARQFLDFCKIVQAAMVQIEQQKSDYLIMQACEYVQQNINQRLMLDEVAKHVFLSRCYFSKLFKQVTGENFKDFLARQRVTYAKKLIRQHPELKIYEIAKIAGFESARYFSRLFKDLEGVTPQQYRGNFNKNLY